MGNLFWAPAYSPTALLAKDGSTPFPNDLGIFYKGVLGTADLSSESFLNISVQTDVSY